MITPTSCMPAFMSDDSAKSMSLYLPQNGSEDAVRRRTSSPSSGTAP